MNDSEFDDLIDETFERIETALDDSGTDADYENSGGVLTIESEAGRSLVFSRQRPNHELWLAAPDGAYHFRHDSDRKQWCCTRSGRTLADIFGDTSEVQLGVRIGLG